MSYFNTQAYSKGAERNTQRLFGEILKTSQKNTSISDNIRQTNINEDLRRLPRGSPTSSLRLETKPQPKKADQISNTNLKSLSKKIKAGNTDQAFNMNPGLLAEAADLENLNIHLLELVDDRLETFMDSVKEFVNVSGRLAKLVYPKSPDVDSVLKNFQNHKATLENNIFQMEKTIQRIGLERKPGSINFNKLLREGYIIELILKENNSTSSNNKKRSTQVNDNFSNENETSSNDISSTILDEEPKKEYVNSLQEIQKLKSLVNNVEDKNNLLLLKADHASSQKQFYSSGPTSFNVHKSSDFSNERKEFPVSPQQTLRTKSIVYSSFTGFLPSAQTNRNTEGFTSPIEDYAFGRDLTGKTKGEDLKIRQDNKPKKDTQLRTSMGTKQRFTEVLETIYSDSRDSLNKQEHLHKLKVSHPRVGSYKEGTSTTTSRKFSSPDIIKNLEFNSPYKRAELDNMIDSIAKKKVQVYQSIKGFEESVTQRANSFSSLVSHERSPNQRHLSIQEISNQEDFLARNSNLKEKLSYDEDLDKRLTKENEQETLKLKYKNLEDEYKELQNKNKGLEKSYSEKLYSLNKRIEDLKSKNNLLVEQFSKDQDKKEKQINELTEKLEVMSLQLLAKTNGGLDSSSNQNVQNWKETQERLSFYEDAIRELEEPEAKEFKQLRSSQTAINKNTGGKEEDLKASPRKSIRSREQEEQERVIREQIERQEETIAKLLEENEKIKQQLEQTQVTIQKGNFGKLKSKDSEKERGENKSYHTEEILNNNDKREVQRKDEKGIFNLKQELKETNELLRVRTREYEETLKSYKSVKNELIEREKRIEELEIEIKEKNADYKALLDEYTKYLRQKGTLEIEKEGIKIHFNQVNRQERTKAIEEEMKEKSVLKEKIAKLEKILREKEMSQHKKMKETVQKCENVISQKLKGLLEEFLKDKELRFSAVSNQLSECQKKIQLIVNRVIFWRKENEEARSELKTVFNAKSELEQRLVQVTKDLQDSNKDNSDLRKENRNLLQKVNMFESIRNGLQTQLQDSYIKIQSLEKITKDSRKLNNTIEEKDKDIKNLETRLRNTEEVLDEKTSQLHSLMKAHNDTVNQITNSLNLTVVQLKNLISGEKDMNGQKQELSLEGAFVVIEGLLNSLRGQRKSPRKECTESPDAQRKRYEKQILDKEQDLIKMSLQLNSRETALVDLSSRHEALIKEYFLKEKAYDKLKLVMDEDLIKNQLKIEELEGSLREITEKANREIEQMKQEYDKKFSRLIQETKSMAELAENHKDIAKSLQNEKEQLENALNGLRVTLEATTKERNAFAYEKEKLKISEAEGKNPISTEPIEKEIQLQNIIVKQLEQLNEKLAEVDRLNGLLSQKGSNASEVESLYKFILKEKDNKIDALEKEIHEIKTAVIEHIKAVQELFSIDQNEIEREGIKDFKQIFSKLLEKSKDLQKNLQLGLNQLEKLQNEQEDLKRKLEEKISVEKRMTEENKEIIHNLEIEIESREKVIEELKGQILAFNQEKTMMKINLEEEIDKLKKENGQIREEISFKETEKNNLIERLHEKAQSKEAEIENLKEERKVKELEYNKVVHGLKEDIKAIQYKLDEVTQKSEIREKENNLWQQKLKDEIQCLQRLLEESRHREETLEHTRGELEVRIQNKDDMLRKAEENRKTFEKNHIEKQHALEKELKDKENKIKKIVNEYVAKEKENKEIERRLKEELQRYRENIDLKEKDSIKIIERLCEEVRVKEEELEKLKEETQIRLNESREGVRRLESQVESKENELMILKEQKLQKEKEHQLKIEELQEKILVFEDEKKKIVEKMLIEEKGKSEIQEGFEGEVKRLEEEIKILKKQNGDNEQYSKQVIEELNKEVQNLRLIQAQNESTIEQMSKDYRELEAELKKLRNEKEEKEKEHKEIEKKLKKELETLAQESEAKIREHEEACIILEETIERMNQEKDLEENGRYEELENLEILQKELKAIEKQSQNLKDKLKKKEEQHIVEINKMNEQLEIREEDIGKLTEEIQYIRENIQIKGEDQSYKNIIADLEAKERKNLASLIEAQKELELLKFELENRNEKLREIQEKNRILEESFNETKKAPQERAERLGQVQKVKEDLERRLGESVEELKRIKEEVKIIQENRDSLEEEIKTNRKKIEELEHNESSNRDTTKEFEKQIQSLNKRMINLKISLETAKSDILAKKDLIEELNNALKHQRTQYNVTFEEQLSEIEGLKVEKASLQNDINELREKLDRIEIEYNKKFDEANQKDFQIAQLTKDLQNEKQVNEKEKQESGITIESLTQEKKSFASIRVKLQAELNQVKSDYEQLKKNHENMQKEDEENYNTLDVEIKELKTENHHLNVMLKEVGNKLQAMQAEIQNKENIKKGLEVQLQELRNLLKQTKETLQAREEELKVKTKKLDDLQEALKQIDGIRSSKEEKVMFLTEELNAIKNTVEEKVKKINMVKAELIRLENENERLEKDKGSLIKALEGVRESTSFGNKTLIAKYEEIIEMNKKTIEEKDKSINDLTKELNAIKLMLSSKEREFEGLNNELRRQVEQLTQRNDYLQKDYQKVKLELSNKSEVASKDLAKLKPLAIIADTLVEYSKFALQDVDMAVDALKERIKELITKESQFEIQVAENETLAMKVTELNRVIDLQKSQFEELHDIVEKNMKFMNTESSKQDIIGLVSSVNTRELTERSRNTFAKLIQEDMEKNLIIEKRFQYGAQRWCLVTNQNVDRLQRRYIMAREEDLPGTPLRAKVMRTEIITLENVDSTHRVTEEVQYVLNEIFRQQKAIRQKFEVFVAQRTERNIMRAVQDLMAANKSLLSRADAIIKRDMKDEEILRILKESEKESDAIRQRCMDLEDEKEGLQAEIKKLTEGRIRRSQRNIDGNPLSMIEGSPTIEKPKFVNNEENKTISNIEDHSNEQSLSVQKSLDQLDDILPTSPLSEVKDEAIKVLENRIEELSQTQNKIIKENTSLRQSLETSEKAIKENENLRFANNRFQIEYERLLEELKDRENDEERFSMQIQILKKELNDTQTKLIQAQSTHEKEHLKKILLKFLDSILKAEYTKETPELLKILCSLVFCSETEKNNLLTLLGKLSAQRKQAAGILKIF